MAVHGRKPKIRHKNMADDVAANGRSHGGKKKKKKYIYMYIYIYIYTHLYIHININKTIDKK